MCVYDYATIWISVRSHGILISDLFLCAHIDCTIVASKHNTRSSDVLGSVVCFLVLRMGCASLAFCVL